MIHWPVTKNGAMVMATIWAGLDVNTYTVAASKPIVLWHYPEPNGEIEMGPYWAC